VFQWGDIGIGRRFSDRKKKNKLTPSPVLFKRVGDKVPPKRLASVWAGGHSTFALDEEGTAFFWGPNNYNQVGGAAEARVLLNLIFRPDQFLDSFFAATGRTAEPGRAKYVAIDLSIASAFTVKDVLLNYVLFVRLCLLRPLRSFQI
jgi:hypothetical protein